MLDDLANALREMYKRAKRGERATAVHLFGIRYADQLGGAPIKEIVLRAGLTESWGTEVRKGMKLAQHVELNLAKDVP
jgi:uncharacterized protein YunC (DUF1805 family)